MNRAGWLNRLTLLACDGEVHVSISAEAVINMADLLRDLSLPLRARSGTLPSSRPRLHPSAPLLMQLSAFAGRHSA